MVFSYESLIGTIRIVRLQNGAYTVDIGGKYYGIHDSAVAAAEAVRCFQTECDAWDELIEDDDVMDDVPVSIGEWDNG